MLMRVLPIEEVLSPISAEDPCGIDLRFDREWDNFEKARSDDGSREGMADEDRTAPNWDSLKELCVDALRHRSKDLRIAMFLVEACARLEGWAGIADSLLVVRELLLRYWDQGLYPRPEAAEPPEPPNYEDRAGALSWLDEKFAQVTSSVPYTARSGGRNYCFTDLVDARKTGSRKSCIKPNGDPDEKRMRQFEALLKAGHISLDMYEEAIRETRWEPFERLSQSFEQAYAEYMELGKTIAEKFGKEAPGIPASRARLDEIAKEIAIIRKRTAPPEPHPAPEQLNAAPSDGGSIAVPAAIGMTVPGAGVGVPTSGSWAEAEAKVRSGDVDGGLAQMARLAATESCGRNSFHRKLLLAEVCLNRNRERLAQTILEELNELIDKHHLPDWETAELVGGVWSRLYKIYRKNQPDGDRTKELYRKLSRLDPWQVMSLAEE